MSTPPFEVPATYKAVMYERYGAVEDVLQLQDVATEPLPSPTHVRIQVYSVALNPIDYKIVETHGLLFTGGSPSADKPYRIGYDVSGVVVEVGKDVPPTDFHVGDAVLAMAPTRHVGALAEYVSIDAQFVVRKPSTLSFTEAAAVPLVSLTSYQALVEHAKLQKGEHMLVLGGSTSAGMFAIQYAKAMGAASVVATASGSKVDLLRSLGADRVIDYTTQQWSDVLTNHSIDVVYDCAVEPQSWDTHAQHVLKQHTGRFVTLFGRATTPSESKFGATHSAVFCRACGAHLRDIVALIECGDVKKPIVDSVFPLDEVSDAIARVKTGRAVGKVVVTVRRVVA